MAPRKSKKGNPVVVSYKTVEDLKILKDWFYNFDVEAGRDFRFRAIQRVRALGSRGRLPHGIEATSFLTSICLEDDRGAKDSNILQMSYTMAIIRFVNGLLDPFQKANFAIPLHQLAKNLGLPGFFVELRHMGTHESLPSLVMLRIACTRALNWLYDNYWCHIEDDEFDDGDEEDISELSEKMLKHLAEIQTDLESIITSTQLLNNLKTYKKIRKSDLDHIYKYGDSSSESAIKYNKAVRYIKSISDIPHKSSDHFSGDEVLATQLVFKNNLIYNNDKISSKEGKLKFNPLLVKLFKPLIQELGLNFQIYLWLVIASALRNDDGLGIRCDLYPRLELKLKHDFEYIQLIEWIGVLFEMIVSAEFSKDFEFVVSPELATENEDIHKRLSSRNELLAYLLIKADEILGQTKVDNLDSFEHQNVVYCKVRDLIKNNNKLNNVYNSENKSRFDSLVDYAESLCKSAKSLAALPTVDDILGTVKHKLPEAELPVAKRAKVSEEPVTDKPPKIYILEPHSDWEPTPFGTFV
ncbi:hypothetical protein G9P44_003982 [Scheffersomyces stipitis]|nr:hypothetical protein G9P44_003982 [Scheffersomyces stipitis]